MNVVCHEFRVFLLLIFVAVLNIIFLFCWEEGIEQQKLKDRDVVGSAPRSLLSVVTRSPTVKKHRLNASMELDVADEASDLEIFSQRHGSPPFCVPWAVNSDDWWSRHIEYEVFHEDSTHYCFQLMPDKLKRAFFRNLYKRQFQSDCSNVTSRLMISSGLAADFSYVIDGLMGAAHEGRTFQIFPNPWHYASPKPDFDKKNAACESQDMRCYFLPLSNCKTGRIRTRSDSWFTSVEESKPRNLYHGPGRWYLEFVSRPQSWLRKRIYDFTQKHILEKPCTVIHVRRADVVLHKQHARRYFPISEYIEASSQIERNILLLTDDHNAIGEAKTGFPDKNWMYINRTRHRGSAGGWESQLPSKDPVFEVTVLFSIFRLVRQCNSMIFSQGGFASLLRGEIINANSSAWFARVEDVKKLPIFSQEHAATVNVSIPMEE